MTIVNPWHCSFGAATCEHAKPFFDDTRYLLALAFADRAFKGLQSLDELWAF